MRLQSWLQENYGGSPVYMVGIKGQGVSALARVMAEMGIDVVGSDTDAVYVTDFRLLHPRIRVLSGFSADHIPADAKHVIFSAGYQPDHVEIAEARRRGLTLTSYPEFVGLLTNVVPTIAVAGTHGKTTTVQLIGHLLRQLGREPVVISGGGPTFVGDGDLIVLEACEYRRHFLKYRPAWAVITNIEWDHPDYYKSLAEVVASFQEFVSGTSPDGTVVLTDNCPQSVLLQVGDPHRRVVAGVSDWADVQAVVHDVGPCRFDLILDGHNAGTAETRLWGLHNVYNALQGLAVVTSMGYDPQKSLEALKTFGGVPRRMEFVGTVGEALIYDDFAHHPSEIRASLKAMREMKPSRLVIVFQPHTYTRTRALLKEFGAELSAADEVILVPIFGSVREQAGDIGSDDLARAIPQDKVRVMEVEDLLGYIRQIEAPGVMVAFMGCGDIGMAAREVVCTAPDAVPADGVRESIRSIV
jgi:UDP-N-acetylmuramate--alanine ligase